MLFDWLSWFITDTVGEFNFNAVHKLVLLCLFLGVALPYTFLDDLRMLRHIGKAVCFVSVLGCTACVVSCIVLAARGKAASGDARAPIGPDSLKDVMLTLPTVCFVYCSIFPLLHVYGSMKRSHRAAAAAAAARAPETGGAAPSAPAVPPWRIAARRDMGRAILWASVIQTSVFLCLTVVTTLTFGKLSGASKVSQNSNGNVLYNFPMGNLAVTACSLLLIVFIVLDYPILLFPAVAQALKFRPCGHAVGTWRYARQGYAVFFTVVILVIDMVVPDLPDVFGLSGSFGCATYELIVPGMILMKTQRTVAKKLVGIVVFLIGLAVMAISGFFIFQSIAEKISSHGVGGGGK